MKTFAELSSGGQTKRLKQAAANALTHYDLPVKALQFLAHHTNHLFKVIADDGKDTPYFLRVNAPHSRTVQNIQNEMDWLAALRQDTDLVVPKPIATKTGAFVHTVARADLDQPRHVALFEWIDGRTVGERVTPKICGQMGEALAQLHNHADTFKPAGTIPEMTLNEAWTCGVPPQVYAPETSDLWTNARRAMLQTAAARVQTFLDGLYADPTGLRFLHIDLHNDNVKILPDGRMAILDFDDSCWAFPLQDLGIGLYYCFIFDEGSGGTASQDQFLWGYTQHRTLQPQHLNLAIAARLLDLLSFVCTHLNWTDAQWRAWLPKVESRLQRLLG